MLRVPPLSPLSLMWFVSLQMATFRDGGGVVVFLTRSSDIWLPCSLFHVGVHLREVVLHDVVGGAVGNGAEAERRLHGAGVGQTAILESDQVGKLLSATKGGLPFTEEILALGEKLAW